MHIPDGYLSPQTAIPFIGIMIPVWAAAAKKVKKTVERKDIPRLASGAAFSFTIMMFNLPMPGGSSAHAVGAVLLAVLLGPWAASIGVSVALIIQAVIFQDGGVLAIGANCFNMGVLMPFAGYLVYRLGAGKQAGQVTARSIAAAAAAGYVGLNLAALATAVELGVQYEWFKAADGTALYFTYPLKTAIAVMMSEHLLLAGPVEAIVTSLGLLYAAKSFPERSRANGEDLETGSEAVGGELERHGLRRIWAALGVLVLLTPLGLYATGTAFGEWGADELFRRFGWISEGFARFGNTWPHALFPDYTIPGLSQIGAAAALEYVISALIGVLLVLAGLWLIGRLLIAGQDREAREIGSSGDAMTGMIGGLPAWMLQPDQPALVNADRPEIGFIKRSLVNLQRALAEEMIQERLAFRPGFLQGIDPAVKVMTLIGLTVLAGFSHSPVALVLLWLFAMMVMRRSRLPVGVLQRRIWGVIPLITLIVSLPGMTNWFNPGHTLLILWESGNPHFHILGLTVPGLLGVTRQGIVSSLMLVFRVGICLNLCCLLTFTTPVSRLLDGLRSLRISPVFVMILELTYRYLMMMILVSVEMFEARTLRSVGRLSLGRRQAMVASGIASLFARSTRLSNDVFDAMTARGYTGECETRPAMRFGPAEKTWSMTVFGIAILVIGAMIYG